MITKTINLDKAYESLFDEIREKSEGRINIDNMEDFFGRIEDIKDLDLKFLRLPLDEPMFEINANTRAISIPNDFRSNGLSVQGDHLAETVFFSIDRYFDFTDLSGADIAINWKMGNKFGKTKNFIMNKDILPGYIVFGWAIDSVVTEKSGTLTFAVEFKKEKNGQLAYRFNTLAANINIKDGLVIPEDIEAVSLENDILSILTNSAFGSGEAAVGNVNWITGNGLVKNNSTVEGEFIPAEFAESIDLITIVNDNGVPSSNAIDLFAEGYVDNTTSIRYTNEVGENIPIFLKVPHDGELSDNHRYYVLVDGSNPPAYNEATSSDIAAWNAEDEEERVDLYYKLAKLTVANSGNYMVRAQGEKYADGTKIGAGEVAISQTVTVPEARTPDKINIVASEIGNGEENSEFSFADDITNVIFIDEEGNNTLTASADLDNFGALQFTWKKKNGNSFVNINDVTSAFKMNNSDVLTIANEGEYKVSVVNFKNGSMAEPVESDTWVASLPASKIISAVCTHNGVPVENRIDFYSRNGSSVAQRSVELTIANVVREENPRGELSYEWRKVVGDGITIVGTEATLRTSIEGTYQPVVKNIYNGSIYTKVLPSVFINDLDNE